VFSVPGACRFSFLDIDTAKVFLWPEALPEAKAEEVTIPPAGTATDDKWLKTHASPPSVLAAGVKGGSLLFFADAGAITWASAPPALFVAATAVVATVKGPDRGGSPIDDTTGVVVAELDETSGTEF